jgi:hypothetical protein
MAGREGLTLDAHHPFDLIAADKDDDGLEPRSSSDGARNKLGHAGLRHGGMQPTKVADIDQRTSRRCEDLVPLPRAQVFLPYTYPFLIPASNSRLASLRVIQMSPTLVDNVMSVLWHHHDLPFICTPGS